RKILQAADPGERLLDLAGLPRDLDGIRKILLPATAALAQVEVNARRGDAVRARGQDFDDDRLGPAGPSLDDARPDALARIAARDENHQFARARDARPAQGEARDGPFEEGILAGEGGFHLRNLAAVPIRFQPGTIFSLSQYDEDAGRGPCAVRL